MTKFNFFIKNTKKPKNPNFQEFDFDNFDVKILGNPSNIFKIKIHYIDVDLKPCFQVRIITRLINRGDLLAFPDSDSLKSSLVILLFWEATNADSDMLNEARMR